MENKKLYAVNTRCNFGEITECNVARETDNIYVVEFDDLFCSNQVVKKSKMETYDKHYCKTYTQAIKFTEELYKKRIEENNKSIAVLMRCNDEIKTKLQELEKNKVGV